MTSDTMTSGAQRNFGTPLLFPALRPFYEIANPLSFAPVVAVQMAMICLIHYPKWAWIDRGMEYPFLIGLVALHIAFRGGGRFSVDRLIGKEL